MLVGNAFLLDVFVGSWTSCSSFTGDFSSSLCLRPVIHSVPAHPYSWTSRSLSLATFHWGPITSRPSKPQWSMKNTRAFFPLTNLESKLIPLVASLLQLCCHQLTSPSLPWASNFREHICIKLCKWSLWRPFLLICNEEINTFHNPLW